MWFARGLMFLCVANLVYSLTVGHVLVAVINAINLLINALTAEFSRRRLESA